MARHDGRDYDAVMSSVPDVVSPETMHWLLEGGAAERHAALTRLLGAAPDAPEVQEARRAIMTEGPVPRILAAQQADGHWEGPDRFYTAKYRGTVWTSAHPRRARRRRRGRAGAGRLRGGPA